jgi:hypothetical protein
VFVILPSWWFIPVVSGPYAITLGQGAGI